MGRKTGSKIVVKDWRKWQQTKVTVFTFLVLCAVAVVAFAAPTTYGLAAVVFVSLVGISAGLGMNILLTSIQRIAQMSEPDDFWM